MTQVNVDYPFVTGPATSTANDGAAFADTTGKVLKDNGSSAGNVTGPASSVSGNVPTFNGITGKVLQDSGMTIAAGVYTPTPTNGTNVSGVSINPCQYMRIGNVVTVSGSAGVTLASISTTSLFTLSLPIASNFANAAQNECAGAANIIANNQAIPLNIRSNTSTKTAEFVIAGILATTVFVSFTFTYVILP